ncbi:polysaccharide deacetylase family protein [Halosimplex aquaticum]
MEQTVGSVVVSVDAELGWGFVDYDSPPESRVESGRSGWRTLCRLFDAYDVPATWAVVGHLFHEACDGRHPDHPAGPEWFAPEREQWADRPDLTCGPELIERVRESGPDHEIGSHTYSHVLFGDDQTTGDVAAAEQRAAGPSRTSRGSISGRSSSRGTSSATGTSSPSTASTRIAEAAPHPDGRSRRS